MRQESVLGASFGVIAATAGRKGPDWLEIEELAGRFADRVLFPEGYSPPIDSLLEAPETPRFQRQVLLHTACELIKRTRMPMYRRVLGLADADGSCRDMLAPLLHHFTSVKVLTEEVPLYRDAAGQMMEELGAPVTLADRMTGLSDCVLILAPEGFSLTGRLPCPVLSNTPPTADVVGNWIWDLQISPGRELSQYLPRGISPHQFTGALYEFCDLKSIRLVAAQARCNGKVAGMEEVTSLILQNAGFSDSF